MYHAVDYSDPATSATNNVVQPDPSMCGESCKAQRKRNYDVNEYFRDALRTGGDAKTHTQQKLVKVPQMQEYQFFDKARIEVLIQKENDLAIQRKSIEAALKEQRAAELRERKRATRTMVARLTATMSEEDALKQVTAEVR